MCVPDCLLRSFIYGGFEVCGFSFSFFFFLYFVLFLMGFLTLFGSSVSTFRQVCLDLLVWSVLYIFIVSFFTFLRFFFCFFVFFPGCYLFWGAFLNIFCLPFRFLSLLSPYIFFFLSLSLYGLSSHVTALIILLNLIFHCSHRSRNCTKIPCKYQKKKQVYSYKTVTPL